MGDIRRDEEREAIWLERLRKADQRFDNESARHLEAMKELRAVRQQLQGAVATLVEIWQADRPDRWSANRAGEALKAMGVDPSTTGGR